MSYGAYGGGRDSGYGGASAGYSNGYDNNSRADLSELKTTRNPIPTGMTTLGLAAGVKFFCTSHGAY